MNPTLRTSASGMQAQQAMIDVIANNLANVNTTGFKSSRAAFEDVLYQTIQGPQIPNGTTGESVAAIQIGKGTRLAAITRIHTQGAGEQTGRNLDLTIEGEGFFQVERPDGSIGYTRDGAFTISENGTLVTHGGYPVLPGITLSTDTTAIAIGASGIVTAASGTSGETTEIGRIELARFINPSGLLSLGENLFAETEASGQPITGFPQEDSFGRILPGTLEASNVEIVQEMVDMIAAQRAYEINARAMSAGEEMMRVTNEILR